MTKTQTISRIDLLNAIREVTPGISKKGDLDQSDSIIFDNDSIYTFNSEIGIYHNFETNIQGAIKAEKFIQLLEKLPQDEIEIKEIKGKLSLKADRIKATIKLDKNITLNPQKIPGKTSKKWKTLPDNFNEGIAFCFFSANTSNIPAGTDCLFVNGDRIASVDGYRGTVFNLSSSIDDDFLLPAKCAKQLSKYSSEKVVIDNGWLYFMNENGTVFSVRTYAEIDYPAYDSFFDVDGPEINLPDEFLEIVSRAKILISADFVLDQFVSLIFSEGKVVCRGEGVDGWFEEEREIEYSGKDLDIKIHPAMFSEVVKFDKKIIIGSDSMLFVSDYFMHTICLSC